MDDMDFGGDDLDFGGGDSGGGDLFGSDTGSSDTFDSGGGDMLNNDIPEDTNSDFTVDSDGNTTDIETNPDTIDNLENQGYDVSMEVNEPDGDFSNPTITSSDTADSNDFDEDSLENGGDDNSADEQTDSDDDIPEDVQPENNGLSDADREWLDNRDEERENWTDGEVPQKVTDENLENSTHNPDAESMTLGKYGDGGDDSYIGKAGDDSTYYNSDNYEGIQDEYHQSDSDMYEAGGNKDFVEQNIDEGKDVQFSHDPRVDDGALGEEWGTVQEKTGANDDDLVEGEDGMLHLENKGTYYDEQPLDKLEDEEWN